MSTSIPGSDRASQEDANTLIKELKCQLSVANTIAQGRQDLETEMTWLRGELRQNQLVASYKLEEAAKESSKLKDELAALRVQLAAKEGEHPKNDTASEHPTGTSESPLSMEALQTENTKLNDELVGLKNVKNAMWRNIGELRGELVWSKGRIQALRVCVEDLAKDNAFHRAAFQKMCEDRTVAEETEAAIYSDAQKLAKADRHALEDFVMTSNREMENVDTIIASLQSAFSAAKKANDSGIRKVIATQAKSDEKRAELHSHLDRSHKELVAMAFNALQQQPAAVLPRVNRESKDLGSDRTKDKNIETTSVSKLPNDCNTKKRKGKTSTIPKTAKDDRTNDVKFETPPTPKVSQCNETKEKQDDSTSTSKVPQDEEIKENPQDTSVTPAKPMENETTAKQVEVILSPKQDGSKVEQRLKAHSDEKGIPKEDEGVQPKFEAPKLTAPKSTASDALKAGEKLSWAEASLEFAESTTKREGPAAQSFPSGASSFGQFQQQNAAGFSTGRLSKAAGDSFVVVPSRTSQKSHHNQTMDNKPLYRKPDDDFWDQPEDQPSRSGNFKREMQTSLPEQKGHQKSERVSMLESELEKAGLRHQELERRYEGLEQNYEELQRIRANVAEENGALNKMIGGTLEAFIPKAERMLHKGIKMDKNTRDLLYSLIKVVRDGLRQG